MAMLPCFSCLGLPLCHTTGHSCSWHWEMKGKDFLHLARIVTASCWSFPSSSRSQWTQAWMPAGLGAFTEELGPRSIASQAPRCRTRCSGSPPPPVGRAASPSPSCCLARSGRAGAAAASLRASPDGKRGKQSDLEGMSGPTGLFPHVLMMPEELRLPRVQVAGPEPLMKQPRRCHSGVPKGRAAS